MMGCSVFRLGLGGMLLAAVGAVSPAIAVGGVPRLPFVSDEQAALDPDIKATFEEIRQHGGKPGNMHRHGANAPKVFRSAVQLAYSLRYGTKTPRPYRELMILRALQIEGGADYEITAHKRMALQCGLTPEQIGAISDWRSSTLFDEKQKAVLSLAEALPGEAGPSDAVFAVVSSHFTPEEIVELTLTGGFYVMTARLTKVGRTPVEPVTTGATTVAPRPC